MLKLGKEQIFFQLLNGQAEVAVQAARAFLVMIGDPEHFPEHAKIMEDIEHKGDELTHQLQNKIASTFITPLDQEDLSELSHALDDVTDLIEAVAARIDLYRLTTVRPDLAPMAQQLVDITIVTATAVALLSKGIKKSKELTDALQQMHTLENQSDKSFRAALGELFHQPGIDPLYVIMWKETYDRVETAVDRCEDVAKIIDNIVVKYA